MFRGGPVPWKKHAPGPRNTSHGPPLKNNHLLSKYADRERKKEKVQSFSSPNLNNPIVFPLKSTCLKSGDSAEWKNKQTICLLVLSLIILLNLPLVLLFLYPLAIPFSWWFRGIRSFSSLTSSLVVILLNFFFVWLTLDPVAASNSTDLTEKERKLWNHLMVISNKCPDLNKSISIDYI